MVKCNVTVKKQDGSVTEYQGVFPSTVDASMDAMEKAGELCKVTATVLQDEEAHCGCGCPH